MVQTSFRVQFRLKLNNFVFIAFAVIVVVVPNVVVVIFVLLLLLMLLMTMMMLLFLLLFHPRNLPLKVWLKSGQDQLRY